MVVMLPVCTYWDSGAIPWSQYLGTSARLPVFCSPLRLNLHTKRYRTQCMVRFAFDGMFCSSSPEHLQALSHFEAAEKGVYIGLQGKHHFTVVQFLTPYDKLFSVCIYTCS